jgi:hypothetical protein
MKTYLEVAAVGWLVAGFVGCEAPSTSNTPAASSTPTTAEQPKEEKPMVAGAPGEPLPEDETPVTDIPRKFNSHDPIHGRRSRRAGGLGTTMAALPYAQFQTMIYNIDEANALYNAEHGDWPKSQEEFIKNIVEFNKIKLPEIPDGEEYCYVPEQGEVGLQIRLKPGSPRSKVPAGTSPQEAMRLLGVDINAVPAPPPRSKQWSSDSSGAKQPAGQAPATDQPADNSNEPSPDIRTRAEQLNGAQTGGQTPGLSEKAKDHAVAPAGGIE